jgi:hypothetical protein
MRPYKQAKLVDTAYSIVHVKLLPHHRYGKHARQPGPWFTVMSCLITGLAFLLHIAATPSQTQKIQLQDTGCH